MKSWGEIVSPNGLMPCDLCNHIPGLATYKGECGVAKYSPMCRCHRGSTPMRDRQAAIDYWNNTRNYEAKEWVQYFIRKYRAEAHGREFHEEPPEPWPSKD